MINIIRAENLKMKRTNIRKSIILLPLLIGILVYGIARNHIDYNGYNWWYTIMLPITAGVIGISFAAKDKRKFEYKGLKKYNIEQWSVWTAKILVAVVYLALANLCMLIVLESTERIVGGQMEDISIIEGVISMLLSVICAMWLIPFSMIVYNLFGRTVTYVTVFFGAIGGLAIASKSYWWICPFSWYSRVQIPILKLRPNGLIVNEGNIILNTNAIFIGVILALGGFVFFTFGLFKLMKWRCANG